MSTLIVNADDFGLTDGVNRAVAELYDAGALTSATLMAHGASFEDAVWKAKSRSDLGVGCHIVLVDGPTASIPADVPTLLGKNGQLRDSLPRFFLDLQRGRVSEQEVEREATAQIQRLQNAGLTISHVDTHKHTHLFPRVARPLMRAAAACGVRAIRNPFEPAWSARFTRGAFVRKVEVTLLRNFETTFRGLCTAFGMRTTDGCIGVSATGRLDAGTLCALLGGLPEGCYELVCHPGYHDQALDRVHTRLRYTREVERQALLEQVPVAKDTGRIHLIRFADLASS